MTFYHVNVLEGRLISGYLMLMLYFFQGFAHRPFEQQNYSSRKTYVASGPTRQAAPKPKWPKWTMRFGSVTVCIQPTKQLQILVFRAASRDQGL